MASVGRFPVSFSEKMDWLCSHTTLFSKGQPPIFYIGGIVTHYQLRIILRLSYRLEF